jgi:hypothetical protein
MNKAEYDAESKRYFTRTGHIRSAVGHSPDCCSTDPDYRCIEHTKLDGTVRSAVRLLTGLTDVELDSLGGFND